MVIGSTKILLGSYSFFWQRTVQNRNKKFCQQLAYIVVNKVYLIWSQKSFRKEYGSIEHLKDIFPKTPTLALLSTIISNVLEYVCKYWQFYKLVQLYKELLDQSNITFIVTEIKKPRIKKLNFLISFTISASAIPKIMIFVDNINIAEEMATYLQCRLFLRLRKREALFI